MNNTASWDGGASTKDRMMVINHFLTAVIIGNSTN
jgi:hypothetical protein